MLISKSVISTARIEVEQGFCNACSNCIKEHLQKIDEINNIRLYPKESIITFNFNRANKLSSVLNMLTKIGYHEKGERIHKTEAFKTVCNC